ncbi:uncharacterized protein LOC110729998 [Chenopodium quinoa]|uniref:uncharacterized protein LOC110729998 n=1 Tax=Chenopodium quinoa TaxID=63459 RepID=UPI000B774C79|nr:uncharacterized protein LOC110729998 [Chenopodium quinoa]
MVFGSTNDFDFPHFSPPPPFHPHPNPPPPPTPIIPPPPSPDPHHPTVIIFVVIISCSCLFLLGALFVSIWCFIKKQRNRRKSVHERKDIDVDEHLKVQEMIVPGCCGPKKVLVSVEDDVRVHEDVHVKSELNMTGKGGLGLREGGGEGSSVHQLTQPESQV